MGRWTADGSRVATNLFEAAAWHYAVKPVCRCGHSTAFNPHGLWWRFERRGWDVRFEKALARFWCIRCKWRTGRRVRPVKFELVQQSVDDIELEYPPDHEWKRAVRRFRC